MIIRLLFFLFREGNSPDHHLSVTYHQLLSQVCRCANVLKQMGEKLHVKQITTRF